MGNVPFNPLRQNQRPGLLLTNGVVYVAWASHQDIEPYHGWVAAFDATTFQQTGAFNVTPDQEGGGIWHSGGGPSVDATGNIFVAPGDGIFTADNGGRDYGNSYLKLSPRNLQLLDSFTPFNEKALDAVDLDTGSGGAMLVDQVGAARPHLMVTATKEQKIYLIDRDNMGRFDPTRDNIVQSIPNAFSGVVRSNPAYWNGNVYWAVDSSPLMMFSFQNGLLNPTPVSKSSVTYFFPGSTPSISANGTTNAIVWTIRNANGPAVLHAFDATDVSRELYNSTQAGGRDSVGTTVRFSVPTIVDGKVFVPTRSSVVVFGLL
jgi:hypothetical protein